MAWFPFGFLSEPQACQAAIETLYGKDNAEGGIQLHF